MNEEDNEEDFFEKTEKRRKVRSGYKEVLKDIEATKEQLKDIHSRKYGVQLKKVNEWFEKSDHTRELSYDAMAMKEITSGLKGHAASLSNLAGTQDFAALANRISNMFKPENCNNMDWTAAGLHIGQLMNFCVSADTMLGPLSKEEKIRKAPVRKAKEQLDSVIQKPQEISVEGADKDDDTNERVTKLMDVTNQLHETSHGKGFDLLKLLVDPEDNVQSVENFFDFSFLVKVIMSYVFYPLTL